MFTAGLITISLCVGYVYLYGPLMRFVVAPFSSIKNVYDLLVVVITLCYLKLKNLFVAHSMDSEKLPLLSGYVEIPYTFREAQYILLSKKIRGKKLIHSVTGYYEDTNIAKDVTEVVIPYLGPNNDCHGTMLTPWNFGYSRIVVTDVLENTYTFLEHQLISLL